MGVMVYMPLEPGGEYRWVMATNPANFRLPMRINTGLDQPDQVEMLTPSGSVLAAPIHRENTTPALVERLLTDSISAGYDGEKIPGWRQLSGWNSEKWQRPVAALQVLDLVETTPTGTHLTSRYETTVDLLADVRSGRVRIRPSHASV
jgi:hypothetical protein